MDTCITHHLPGWSSNNTWLDLQQSSRYRAATHTNTWTVQRRNIVARLATIQQGSSLAMVHGSCTMHPFQTSFVFSSRHNLFGQARMILAWMVHTAFQLYVCAWRLPFCLA